MKSLKEYYKTGSMYYNASTSKSVYSDMDPKEKAELDKMAKSKFGRRFIDCSWDEKSGLRSALDTKASEEEGDVEDIIKKDANADKERINKDIDKGTDSEEDEDSDYDSEE